MVLVHIKSLDQGFCAKIAFRNEHAIRLAVSGEKSPPNAIRWRHSRVLR